MPESIIIIGTGTTWQGFHLDLKESRSFQT
jgi:hypothetical protein